MAEDDGGEGFVIDPSYEPEPLLEAIERHRVRVRYILNTHRHHDHTAGNSVVHARTGARTVAHRLAPTHPDIPVDDGAELRVGALSVDVLSMPGHTVDSVFYRFAGYVATGDTLFVGECGRTDLESGDPSAMFDTLLGRVARLDDALVVLPGHDYGTTPTSTIGREKRENYTLQPRTREEFLAFMRA
ncbi:MAG: hydroxyacylglutathione hydrolase family protein [Thermoplasmata archaeon]